MIWKKIALAGVVSLAAAHASAQQPDATVAFNASSRATVETVDVAKREVLLRDETGFLTTVEVGPEVTNLASVRPGDRVVRRYHFDATAAMAQPGTAPQIQGESVDVTRARPGERPGQRVADVVRARVTIEGVDMGSRTVALIGPAGMPRRFTLETPQMIDFARNLKPGDQVDLTFREVENIRIEPR